MIQPVSGRRLAAIMAADLAGYSAMMEKDEAGTVKALRRLLTDVVEPRLAEHDGRLFKTMGDGYLVEFASVVSAVACAHAIQRDMARRNDGTPATERMDFRVGVHLGDVIAQGDDLFGDGVNVAARIEGLALPGGVAVSAMVRETVGSRLDLPFEDIGEQRLKNISAPVRIFRIAASLRPEGNSANPPRSKPSIAVLPFTNMSGDAEQGYLSDGLTEDIITGLSRFRSLFVIARNSSFAFKDRAVNMVDAGRELGVQFIVEGSIRRIGDRVRITAQLNNATSGNHVWAERYDRPFAEIFALQDEVVAAIVATTEGRVAADVAGRGHGRPTPMLSAYEAVLRARHALADYKTEIAGSLLRQAVATDPAYAQAYAWLAWIGMVHFFNDLQVSTIDEAVSLGKKAVALDPDDSQCRANLALAYVFQRRFELADIQSIRAIELNPSDGLAVNARAQFLARAGRGAEALGILDDALRRDPFPPSWYWGNRATALICLGQFGDAIDSVNRKNRNFWWDRYMRAVCYASLQELSLARIEVAEMLRERSDATIRSIMVAEPFRRTEDSQRLLDGLRSAGVPE